MEIKGNLVSPYLLEMLKWNHNNFLLDKEQRIHKLQSFYNKVIHIRDIIDNLPREELDKTDLKFLSDFTLPLFGFAYYGENVRHIIREIVGIYKKVFRTYIESWENKFSKNYFLTEAKPKKILFISDRLNRFSSVLRDRGQIIQGLSETEGFYIDVMTKLPIDKQVEHLFTKVKNIYPFRSLNQNLDTIYGGRYDIVVFPDIHMDSTSNLSLFRLAPKMITTFGHSETSGTCDFFVSSTLYELPSEREKNYTENLCLFKSLNMKYSHTLKPDTQTQPLAYYGLPPNKHLYLCSSSPFKFGKETLDIFKSILEKDPDGYIVLTKLSPNFDIPLFESLTTYIGNTDRIKILPRQSVIDLMGLNKLVDCVLDPYPFGNLNTTLECFEVGTPVVTMPTNKANGRFTLGFYQRIGLLDYVVFNIEDYVNKAIEIANKSPEEKQKNREILKSRAEILYNEEQSLEEWRTFLLSL